MTREEQLQQFAEQYTKGLYLDRHNLIQMVKAGAEWADQHPNWIPVEERLPEVGEKVIFYSPGIDDWLSGAFQQDGTWWNEEYGTHFYGVTHWMEIVPPRKEEDNE